MTTAPAFTTSFTGVSVSRPSPAAAVSPKTTPRRPSSPAAPPVAVVSNRTPSKPAWGVSAPAVQTYQVSVIQKNRTTIVEVDRDTDLRTAMLSNRVDVYTLGGKLRNCGGGGQCGTCLIDIVDGVYHTNGRTPREEFVLKDKPSTWRLACRTLVTGDVTVKTKPQV